MNIADPVEGGATNNTAVGQGAGQTVTTGINNTYIGQNSGLGATDGNNNTGLGSGSLSADHGAANTGIGKGSLSACTGANNTALGYNSGLYVTVGNANVAIGSGALDAEVEGGNNVAIGANALTLANAGGSTGSSVATNNTCVGHGAGDGITSGKQNTGLGSAVAFDVDADNQTAIGYQATTDSANDIAIGNTSVDEIKGQVDFSTFSDERIKTNIIDGDLGLNFINMLKTRKFNKVCPADYPDSIRKPADESAAFTDSQTNKIWDGLIAQEVKSAIDSCSTTFSGWNEESNSKQLVTYSTLVIPLIKAVQELSEQVEELKSKLGE